MCLSFLTQQIMLRDYQLEICTKVNEALKAHRSIMMQMPTGTGKTVVLASLVKQYMNREADCAVLIVAHRIELIEQIGEHLKGYGIDYGVMTGGRNTKETRSVLVTSIQTLSSKLNSLSSLLFPSLVVIDEAHHALAKTYQMLWAAWPEAKFLGLTATPYRMSGEGFTDLFEVLAESWSVRQFIADGWLSPYDYYSIRPESKEQQEIDSLKKRGADGDFQMKELSAKLDVRPSIERLFESFERFAFDKKGIIYAIDIAHAEHIAEFYRLQGVHAVAISSKTPANERAETIRNFKGHGSLEFRELSLESPQGSGQLTPASNQNSLSSKLSSLSPIQILVSVDLFSEGFDCPDAEFIQLARPTLSLAKYLQMVGRGLRPCKGKTCCTIIDNVGLYRTFGLPSADRDWEYHFLGKDLSLNIDLNHDLDHNLNLHFPGSYNGSLPDGRDEKLVKIVAYEDMRLRFAFLCRKGFERRKKGNTWVWTDLANGVEFDRHPSSINFRGMELSTADGETFFPRISSKWIDAKHGIDRKALETQAGDGIGWMKLYISFAMPGKVLQLQSVKPNLARIYKDEEGKAFLQQDLDHTPVEEEEAGGRKAFMALCDKQLGAWEEMKKSIRTSSLEYDARTRWWQLPEGSVRERMDGQPHPDLYHIVYDEHGERKEFWVDGTSGFTYRHRPVMRKRGFVELLYDGEVAYIQNIREERFMPYRNWEIRADERLCAIDNKLYFCEERDESSYRIRKRSDDFRMFVVEKRPSEARHAERRTTRPNGQGTARSLAGGRSQNRQDSAGKAKARKEGNDKGNTMEHMAYDAFMIINKTGKQLEITPSV